MKREFLAVLAVLMLGCSSEESAIFKEPFQVHNGGADQEVSSGPEAGPEAAPEVSVDTLPDLGLDAATEAPGQPEEAAEAGSEPGLEASAEDSDAAEALDAVGAEAGKQCPGAPCGATYNCDPSCGALSPQCEASCNYSEHAFDIPFGTTTIRLPEIKSQVPECGLECGGANIEWWDAKARVDGPVCVTIHGPSTLKVHATHAELPPGCAQDPTAVSGYLVVPNGSGKISVHLTIAEPTPASVVTFDVRSDSTCEAACSNDPHHCAPTCNGAASGE